MIDSTEKNYDVTEDIRTRLARRYVIQPGNVMMTREQSGGNLASVVDEEGNVRHLPAADERKKTLDEFSPWGRVLLVGPPLVTDYGQVIRPHTALIPGVRILVGRTTPENYDFSIGETTVTVGMCSFRSIRVIDRGEEAELDATLDAGYATLETIAENIAILRTQSYGPRGLVRDEDGRWSEVREDHGE